MILAYLKRIPCELSKLFSFYLIICIFQSFYQFLSLLQITRFLLLCCFFHLLVLFPFRYHLWKVAHIIINPTSFQSRLTHCPSTVELRDESERSLLHLVHPLSLQLPWSLFLLSLPITLVPSPAILLMLPFGSCVVLLCFLLGFSLYKRVQSQLHTDLYPLLFLE